MARRAQQQSAYILHTRPYSESSLLVDAFSRAHGRINLLAKGARRIKSRTRALLRPFQPLLLSWTGKSDLQTLTGADSMQWRDRLESEDWYCACYMNELLLKLIHPHDPHETLYDIYDQALAALQHHRGREPVLRLFEKHLLSEIGYGLLLTQEVEEGESIVANKYYQYLPGRGPVVATTTNLNSPWQVQGETLLALHHEQFKSRRSIEQSKPLLRALINQALMGRELRSRRIYQRIRFFQ